jgi:hypothetical protein
MLLHCRRTCRLRVAGQRRIPRPTDRAVRPSPCPELAGREGLVTFKVILHHLAGHTERETLELQHGPSTLRGDDRYA